jgi:hypothetical protein
MSVDLRVHTTSSTKPATEKEEREQRNRLRLWMIAFQTDMNMAIYYGKPATLLENRYVTSILVSFQLLEQLAWKA